MTTVLQPYARILLVDDSATARKCIRLLLNELGFFYIREASNGRDAILKLSAQPFELVISDWDMEPVDGLALLKWMRQSTTLRHTLFVMATVYANRKYEDLARDHGATVHLTKPAFGTGLGALLADLHIARAQAA